VTGIEGVLRDLAAYYAVKLPSTPFTAAGNAGLSDRAGYPSARQQRSASTVSRSSGPGGVRSA
jgi:hypothetical protein